MIAVQVVMWKKGQFRFRFLFRCVCGSYVGTLPVLDPEQCFPNMSSTYVYIQPAFMEKSCRTVFLMPHSTKAVLVFMPLNNKWLLGVVYYFFMERRLVILSFH